MRIALWRSPAQTQPRSTTSTPGKEGSFQEQMLILWSGTQRDPSMKVDPSIHRLASQAAVISALKLIGVLSHRLLPVCRTVSVDNQVQGGDVNLYEGLRCHGVPLVTISRGNLVYENGIFTCAEGSGKFCPMRTFPDYLYKKMVQRAKV